MWKNTHKKENGGESHCGFRNLGKTEDVHRGAIGGGDQEGRVAAEVQRRNGRIDRPAPVRDDARAFRSEGVAVVMGAGK